MGKRSTFERRDRDYYPTPREAIKPLIDRLWDGSLKFAEPCCGDGALAVALEKFGHRCVFASDVDPKWSRGERANGLALIKSDLCGAHVIITNPPWSRDILHPMIRNFSGMKPTWLLFDADWMHTRQAAEFLPWCAEIISVGRVKWIPDSPHTGKDNAAWYLFDRKATGTQFTGRQAA